MQRIPEQTTTTFTQEDINQGKIIYHQQAPGGANDSLLLEATNGVTRVGPVRLEIDVVPAILPLQVRRVQTWREGGVREAQAAVAHPSAG